MNIHQTPLERPQAQTESHTKPSIVWSQVVLWGVYLLSMLWAVGAIYFDGPLGRDHGNAWMAGIWAVFTGSLLIVTRRRRTRFLIWLIAFLVVLVPWMGIQASNDREWSAEWAKTSWVEFEGAELTFHNVRNFDYPRDGSVRERWESRRYRLSKLSGVDYFQVNFGGDLIAHTMLSFDFGADGRLVLSVETRRESGEPFSKIGGFYKMFELQYLWGDERDLVRVRTNLRDEPVYLYRTRLTAEQALYMLLDSVRETNRLKERPRFYNLITANCTTSLLAQTLELRESPFDIRMLANGRLDQLIYEKNGFISGGRSFNDMRRQAFINEAAKAAHDDAEFSRRIRSGRPGFE